MGLNKYQIEYYNKPLNNKIRSLNVMRHQQIKKGNMEKATNYQKRIDELKVQKVRNKSEELIKEAERLRLLADEMELEIHTKYGE